jgi:hypothetical protein
VSTAEKVLVIIAALQWAWNVFIHTKIESLEREVGRLNRHNFPLEN